MSKETHERIEFALLQRVLLQDAEHKIQLGRMLDKPTVVMDLTSEFWPVLTGRGMVEEVVLPISSGDLIPLTAQRLGDFTQNHAYWYACMHQDGSVPLIPTIVKNSSLIRLRSTRELRSKFPVRTIPNIYVHKVTVDERGVSLAHRGAGISLVRGEMGKMAEILPKHDGEFLQQFVLPPEDSSGQRYIRDFRVFVVGGQPVQALVRRAQSPLSEANIRGDVVPTLDQIYSARAKGPKEVPTKEQRENVFVAAAKVCSVLDDEIRQKSFLFSRYSLLGYMSIDFLQDSDGTFVPVDCDIQPGVDTAFNMQNVVANHLADYISYCANETGIPKQVIIMGYPRESFCEAVFSKTRKRLGENRTIFQKSILFS